MLSEDELAQLCSPRTLQRARLIASSNKNILSKQVSYNGSEVNLSAFVASSSGWSDRYRTSVSFDDKANFIKDYACTCPAYREHDGMCKHTVALTLNYLQEPQKFMGYEENRGSKTSSSLSGYMQRADARRKSAEILNCLHLSPTLSYSYKNWSVRFNVGTSETQYVIKSLSEFMRFIRCGEFHSYGKKLAFTHSVEAFDNQSQEMIAFLARAIKLRERTSSSTYMRYGNTAEIGKSIDLTDAELIELLNALGPGPITIESNGSNRRAITHAAIRDENPIIHLRITPAENGGYILERNESVSVITHAHHLYAWVGDDIYRCTSSFAQCSDFLRNVYDSDDDILYLAKEDLPLFCATVLPNIKDYIRIEQPSELDRYAPLPCKLEFYFDKVSRAISVSAEAVYGSRRFKATSDDEIATAGGEMPVENDADAPAPLRDETTEKKAKLLVEKYFAGLEMPLSLQEEDKVAALLFGGLNEFKALGEVYTTPEFDRLIREGKPRVSMGVSLSGNLINLEIQSSDIPAEELALVLASYRKHKKYHRLKNGVFVNLEEAELSQLNRLAEDLNLSSTQIAQGHAELPSFRAFYLDEEENLERDRDFVRYIENFKAVDETKYRIPKSLEEVLRPYQKEGYRWLRARCEAGFGGILADEMGLGKSIQLISLVLSQKSVARKTGPSLIVCPASLVYNWTSEFEQFAPSLNVKAVTGAKHERAAIRREAFADGSKEHVDVLITSYDLLRIDAKEWAKYDFWLCALDEAQYIKNPGTLTARATKRVKAQHRFALTGTPMENRLSELWSIFDFLMPGLLGPYTRFKEHYEIPIVGGDEEISERLQASVGPFMLRRLKADVLKELPDKLESALYVPMGAEQRKLYDAHEQKLREELTRQHNERKARAQKRAQGIEVNNVEVLAELMKLRQLCCDPRLLYENYKGGAAKLDAIIDLVSSAIDADEKTLVFSQFTSFLDLIAKRLDQEKVHYFTITGATPKQKRVALVNTFNDDDTPVFLISLKAGGTGLNLTGASVVIHADPWWNAAAQNQATDRAHRIGQTKVVSVQRVIAKGTIEERILHLQEAKSELAEQVIGASGISLSSLSADDLLELLEG